MAPDPTSRTIVVEQAALLWCMRVFVVGLHHPANAPARIQRMCDELDAPDAAAYLGGFMFALQHGATRTIAVDCICYPGLSDDERTLLDAIGLAQERRPFEALLLLRGLLTPEGARAALHSAEQIGAALARAGRFLPAPEAEVRHFILSDAGLRPEAR